LEKDSLGELSVPEAAYYGIQTVRASQNFPISGLKTDSAMVDAVMHIKKAAALTNSELGWLDKDKTVAIMKACDEVLEEKFRDQFIVDVFQMGAGTSFHMNCNEVLANRASEILGGTRGDYTMVHPNDHVNMGQSTNDVFPTAMRLSGLTLLNRKFYIALLKMEEALMTKGDEFDNILKSGRTHLQDGAPIRLGQEFNAYGMALKKGREFLEKAAGSLLELGMGGSAVGTGLNTDPRFPELMVGKLSWLTGHDLRAADDLREAMQSMRPFTEVSGAIRNLALDLNRIANDLRLLASGPRTGLAEITLPPVAPGSSIMPGKVNPSMLEMLNMVCYQVVGCDSVISSAAQAGQLELNVMMPVIAFNLHFAFKILGNALREVKVRCIDGIEANLDQCRKYAEETLGLATALSPIIGYTKASEVAKEAKEKGKSLVEVIKDKELLNPEELEGILDAVRMTEPGIRKVKKQ
jgi:aspartate ammonia-lyase